MNAAEAFSLAVKARAEAMATFVEPTVKQVLAEMKERAKLGSFGALHSARSSEPEDVLEDVCDAVQERLEELGYLVSYDFEDNSDGSITVYYIISCAPAAAAEEIDQDAA